MTSEEMALELHRSLGGPVGERPAPINGDRLWLRMTLIVEEVVELLCAMTGTTGDDAEVYRADVADLAEEMFARRRAPDLAGVADGACDSHVVISGTCVEFGIPEDRVYAEVHRTNMAKAGGPTRADGKHLKPEGWVPPDVRCILVDAGMTA